MSWIALVALGSSMLTGFSGILDSVQVGDSESSAQAATVQSFLICGLLGASIAWIGPLSLTGFSQALNAGLYFGIGLFCQQIMMVREPASKVVCLTAGYPICTEVMGASLHVANLTMESTAACLVIVCGVWLVMRESRPSASESSDLKDILRSRLLFSTVCWAIVATVCFGITPLLEVACLRTTSAGGALAMILISRGGLGLAVCVFHVWQRRAGATPASLVPDLFKTRTSWVVSTGSMVASAVGAALYFGSLTSLNIVEVTIIASSYPVWTLLGNVIARREKMTTLKVLAVALVIAGCTLAAL